jgi:hypothetical protein
MKLACQVDAGATYEFDGDLLVVQEICAFENDTEGSLSNFLPNPVMNADDVR